MTTATAVPGLAAQPRQAFVEQVMGLPVSVHVRGPQARTPAVARAVAGLFASLRDDDAVFSTYRPDSAVSRIRRGALRLDDAGPRVREVAALCAEAETRTDGAFSAWLPDAAGHRAFDPTGLVKGWAVQRAFDVLTTRLDGHDVLVNAGGDVAVRCTRTDTPPWRIAIEDPRDRTRTLVTVPLRTGAVATSGTAARGTHLDDPRTGRPAASGLLSATVIGPSLLWADVYATAAFVMGAEAAEWVDSLGDHAVFLV
ncbi:FAD:protein FMN transferase [Spongisporangium articulatum]|uniref:FAD:protein FMN transferase n=1 Tax=Spongisporangium articulatum TaxID=3362603 RepID=A0ABW8AMM5_9ACTN